MKNNQLFSSIFHLGIRQKILLILIVVMLTALSFSSWLAFEQERDNMLREVDHRGADISRFVAKSLVYSVVGYDYHTIQLLLDEIIRSDDVEYARVTSKRGNIMAESGSRNDAAQKNLLVFEQDISLNDDVVGKLVLGFSIGSTLEHLEERKYSLIMHQALIILLIAIGEFYALSFLIIRPVCLISDSLNNNLDEDGVIAEKIPVNSNDELGYLATSFNNLFAQLNEANKRLRSKMQLADQKLVESNKALREQSRQLKIISDKFEMLSVTDPLTGLHNRRQFEKELEASMGMTRRHADLYSVIIIDIDHFKKINDQHGHPCGDAVLQQVARYLQSCIRSTDILCRIGGEEFGVICNRADKDNALLVAEKLRSFINTTQVHYLDISIALTISLGVATIDHESSGEDSYVLYRNADQAVYRSKQNGRNLVTHFDQLKES